MSYKEALFSFEGRMSLRDYWLKGAIFIIPLAIFNNILVYGVGTEAALNLAMLIGLVTLWPALALAVKRMHDHNRSGWFLATLLIPVANIFFALWIMAMIWFLRGTVGENRFGPDPVESASQTVQQPQDHSMKKTAEVVQKIMRPVLKGVTGQYAGSEIELTDRVIIGRDAGMANLIYPSDYGDVSRQHCGIHFDQGSGKFILEDYSSNGTFLSNDQKLITGKSYYLDPGESFYLLNRNELFEVNLKPG